MTIKNNNRLVSKIIKETGYFIAIPTGTIHYNNRITPAIYIVNIRLTSASVFPVEGQTVAYFCYCICRSSRALSLINMRERKNSGN